MLPVAACTISAARAAADPRLPDNPLLRSVRDNAPDKLPELLCHLDQITHAPATRDLDHVPRDTPTSREINEIDLNPAIKSAYQVSPDAMLELLKRMMSAAGRKPN